MNAINSIMLPKIQLNMKKIITQNNKVYDNICHVVKRCTFQTKLYGGENTRMETLIAHSLRSNVIESHYGCVLVTNYAICMQSTTCDNKRCSPHLRPVFLPIMS